MRVDMLGARELVAIVVVGLLPMALAVLVSAVMALCVRADSAGAAPAAARWSVEVIAPTYFIPGKTSAFAIGATYRVRACTGTMSLTYWSRRNLQNSWDLDPVLWCDRSGASGDDVSRSMVSSQTPQGPLSARCGVFCEGLGGFVLDRDGPPAQPFV